MEPRGVLVSYSLESSKNPFSCSGTLISENWVLAHGSLLEPLVWKTDDFKSLTDELEAGVLATNRGGKSLEFTVSYESDSGIKAAVPCCGGKVIPNLKKSGDTEPAFFVSKKARLAATWKCPLLGEIFIGILSSWRFSESSGALENVTVPDEEIFPLMLLLEIDGGLESGVSDPLDALRNFVKILARPKRGLEVEIESTPFGNPVFINSLSKGVVSNILGPEKSLIITDANAVIGCEGGPIFIRYKSGYRAVCGIVVAPVCWCRGEWVGYTLGVNLLPCLQRLLDPSNKKTSLSSPISGPGIIELLDRSVVVVRCGSGWGSGVLIDKTSGSFLTCSHVVKEAPNSRITISNPIFTARGELVYKTNEHTPYDLAVIRIDPKDIGSGLRSMPISDAIVNKRDEIVCAGFPLISTLDQPTMYPTVTRGRVSHVSAGMLQTSCCIQSGTSGGPVASYPGGELVGIVVCNATSAGRKALFPRVNMAVPAAVFREPIMEYLRTKDVGSLIKLENGNSQIQQKWNLNLNLTSLPSHL